MFNSVLQHSLPNWGRACKSHLQKLSILQNKITRACLFCSRRDSTALLYSKFGVLKLEDMINMEIAKFMFKFYNKMLPNSFDSYFTKLDSSHSQRWSRGHKARGQGQGQGHKKKSEAKAKDSLSEDRHSRGQGQECSRPRLRTKDTSASALQKKKVLTKIFQAISTKKRFPKNFSSALQNFNNSKNSAVLEPKTGQFSRTWGLEAKAKAKDLTFEAKAKAKDFKMCPRGQGRPQGLHLWSQL